jgi:hypothetical protein
MFESRYMAITWSSYSPLTVPQFPGPATKRRRRLSRVTAPRLLVHFIALSLTIYPFVLERSPQSGRRIVECLTHPRQHVPSASAAPVAPSPRILPAAAAPIAKPSVISPLFAS